MTFTFSSSGGALDQDHFAKIGRCEMIIQYHFSDPELLWGALQVHNSHGNCLNQEQLKEGHQQLQPLGDAVVRLILTNDAYDRNMPKKAGNIRMNEVIRKEFGQQLGAKCGIEACINDKAPQAFTAATIQAIIGAVYRDCGGEMKTLSNVARALGLLPKKCEGANPAPVFKFQGQKDANSKKTTPHATAISQKATLTQEPVNVPQPAPVKASAAVQRSPAVNAPSNVHPMITRSKAVARKESLTVQGLMTENEALLVLSLKANKEAATVKESSAVKKATALQKAPAVEESSTLQKATLGRKSLAQRVATLQRAAFVEKSLAALKTMSIQGDPRFKKGTAPKKSNCLQSPPTSSISSSPRSSSPAFSNATSGGVRLNTQSFWVAQKPVFKSSTAIVGTVTAADGGSWW